MIIIINIYTYRFYDEIKMMENEKNKIIKYSNRKFIIYDFMEGEIDTSMVKKIDLRLSWI